MGRRGWDGEAAADAVHGAWPRRGQELWGDTVEAHNDWADAGEQLPDQGSHGVAEARVYRVAGGLLDGRGRG